MRPFNIILLGDPSAGKATQARDLVRRYGLKQFDFGSWLRQLKTDEARKKFKLNETSEKGKLTPTNLARMKFKEVIFETAKSKGLLFNGNPKMLGEAKLMAKWFPEAGRMDPLVIYLGIPKKEMVKRIEIRQHAEKRFDDAAQHLQNRMKYYAKDIPETVAFLKSQYLFKKVSGMGTRGEVFERLVVAIDSMKKKAAKEA